MRGPDELRALVDRELDTIVFAPELGALAEPMRYALAGGGKRIRPTLCLATTEAAGGAAEDALPAAVALELVHTFSLVHDDLPELDDDDDRRGRPSTHVAYGHATALLAGDALLAEAYAMAVRAPGAGVVEELAAATLGMIGGQHLDVTDADVELARIHALKTGCLFTAAVGLGLRCAGVPEGAHGPWRAFGAELGLLFQVVDDVLDGDGYVVALGSDGARALAADVVARAHAALDAIDADTTVLHAITDDLASRSS